ncbi:hypothetical protein ARMSODRAFT_1014843 [Armillaria solidipes]|uniref:Apiosidase-like catalytic domain-containing protein n=1 Tax=Armillaria solidipes TaxID=1076256 RepID=A0A2H3C4L1_9AGAR|nr:hypothetical protein ARMSODRAFT_1014843 [Armillaria solidipes]
MTQFMVAMLLLLVITSARCKAPTHSHGWYKAISPPRTTAPHRDGLASHSQSVFTSNVAPNVLEHCLPLDKTVGRLLTDVMGRPFFLQAGTPWEIFHRLNEMEVEHYFVDRAKKHLKWRRCSGHGMTVLNVFEDLPFVDYDFTQLNERYWTWITGGWQNSPAPHAVSTTNAAVFDGFIGKRYVGIPEVTGGDTNGFWPPRHEMSAVDEGIANQTHMNIADHRTIFNALAYSVYDTEKALLPEDLEPFNLCHATKSWFDTAPGPSLRSTWFGNEAWLKMDGSQTGHAIVTRTDE